MPIPKQSWKYHYFRSCPPDPSLSTLLARAAIFLKDLMATVRAYFMLGHECGI